MIWLLLAWVAYGAWAVAMKKASAAPFAWFYLAALVAALPVDLWTARQALGTPRPSWGLLGWSAVVALTGILGGFAYLRAHRELGASQVAAVVATYPAAAALWFCLADGEALSARQILGVVLAIAGAVLLS